MPSYLSSTQTSGPSRVTISVASSAGEASMNLSGWNRARAALPSSSSRARPASRPTSPTSMPAHLTSSSGRSNAFAMAASTRPSRRPIRRSPPSTLTMYLAVSGSARSRSDAQDGRLAGRPGGQLDLGEGGRHLGEGRARLGRRLVAGGGQDLGHGDAQVGRPVVRLAKRGPRDLAEVGHGRRDGRPAEPRRALIRLGEGASGQEDRRDRAARRA